MNPIRTVSHVRISTQVKIVDGVAIAFDRAVGITASQLADAIRKYVHGQCRVEDDAGCDWYYDLDQNIIFICDRDWVATRNPHLVQLYALADKIEGHNNMSRGGMNHGE